tara:strand:+ start:267 stop:446 length:180 start_codon:yes stop_codon:yes gene_type:complete
MILKNKKVDKMKLTITKICLVALTIGGLVFIYDTLKSEKEPIKLEQHEIYLLPEVTIDG